MSQPALIHPTKVTVPAGMSAAVNGICEVCQTMFGVELAQVGGPVPFRGTGMAYGLGQSLLMGDGSWELALFGSREAMHAFARVLMGLGEDEQPIVEELLDLLGEVVNMAAGIVKRTESRGREINLGIPLKLLDADCQTYVPHAIPILAQPLAGPDFEGELYLVWSERNADSLLLEVQSVLRPSADVQPHDLARGMSLLQEFEEGLGEGGEAISATVQALCSILESIINDELADAKTAYAWVLDTISSLAACFREGRRHLYVTPALPRFAVDEVVQSRSVQSAVERDPETIESFSDFLQESEEGLDLADQTLLAFENGADDKEGINALFRVFHSIKGVSSFLDIADVTRLAHVTETLLALVRDGKMKLAGSALDVVFEATEMMRQTLGEVRRAVEASLSFPVVPGVPPLIERIEAVMRGEEVAPARRAAAAEGGPTEGREAGTEGTKLKNAVKVDVELITQFAERVEALAKLRETLRALGLPAEAQAALTELDGICVDLRQATSMMQMVSLSTLFQKMTRMVRDLSKKTGKLARLVLAGQDTLIERTMAEKLSDPLVHMIRNAVDHGIEDSERRRGLGKPALGTVKLSAAHEESGGRRAVVIRLQDDGKGLDPDMLRDKAISKGLIPASSDLSRDDCYQLIFLAGFSTAAAVTAISGRGVGMDVVRRNIEALGGKIQITSEVGRGSTFTITLPLVV